MYHVSNIKSFSPGQELVPSCVRYERMCEDDNVAGCLMLLARMTSRWGDAPLWGHRSIHDVPSRLIDGVMGEACGQYVWMVETLEEARDLADITGGTIYEVEAESVSYVPEDGRRDNAATIYPVTTCAIVVAKVS